MHKPPPTLDGALAAVLEQPAATPTTYSHARAIHAAYGAAVRELLAEAQTLIDMGLVVDAAELQIHAAALRGRGVLRLMRLGDPSAVGR